MPSIRLSAGNKKGRNGPSPSLTLSLKEGAEKGKRPELSGKLCFYDRARRQSCVEGDGAGRRRIPGPSCGSEPEGMACRGHGHCQAPRTSGV